MSRSYQYIQDEDDALPSPFLPVSASADHNRHSSNSFEQHPSSSRTMRQNQGGEWSRANSIVTSFWPGGSGNPAASNGLGGSRGPRASLTPGPGSAFRNDQQGATTAAADELRRRKSYVEVEMDQLGGSGFARYRRTSATLLVGPMTRLKYLFRARRLALVLLTPITLLLLYLYFFSDPDSEPSEWTIPTIWSSGSWIGETARGQTSGFRGKVVGGHGEYAGRVPPRTNPLKARIPLKSFRDNLKDDHGYVTSFPYGGMTNQLIELFKLMHLGQLLDRDVIVSELKATHSEGKDVYYSKFFDLDLFSYLANVSLVEWHEVKIPLEIGTVPESLSCWGWKDESPLKGYNIKTFFWPPPGQLTVPSSIETSMSFPAIEVLASQNNRQWLDDSAMRMFGGWTNAPAPPDKRLLCFENLFYVPSIHFVEGSVDETYTIEEMSPQDPVWTSVGQHLHFNSHIQHIGSELLTFLLGHSGSTKPFIGVHLRRGDFVKMGRVDNDDLGPYIEHVRDLQELLKKRQKWGSQGRRKGWPVIFATDSTELKFLRRLNEMGWIRINHQEFATDVRFGGWYPSVLDSLLLSKAAGFVGTKQSTFSYLAARRVETWNGGLTRIAG